MQLSARSHACPCALQELEGRRISVVRAVPQDQTKPGTPAAVLGAGSGARRDYVRRDPGPPRGYDRGYGGYDRGYDRGGYERGGYGSYGSDPRYAYDRGGYDRYGGYGCVWIWCGRGGRWEHSCTA